jgi:hypothetical protein
MDKEHDAQTDRIISPPMYHQRRSSPSPWLLGMSHHRKPDFPHDFIRHLGDTEALDDATRISFWRCPWVTEDLARLNDFHCRNRDGSPQTPPSLSVTDRPPFLPSPHIQCAEVVEQNDVSSVPKGANRDHRLEENETIATSEPTCGPPADRTITPLPHPASVPCTPSRTRSPNILFTPYYNQREYNNCFMHPSSFGSSHTQHAPQFTISLSCLPCKFPVTTYNPRR